MNRRSPLITILALFGSLVLGLLQLLSQIVKMVFSSTPTSGNTGTQTSINSRQPSQIPEYVLEREFDVMLDRFSKGEFAGQFNSSLMLKRGEKLILDIPGISYCEEKTVKTKGSYQGFSVRVMRGVSYRFGGFEGAPVQEVVELDTGSFILTNKRLIFSGSTDSVEYPLSKIVTIEPLEDGILVNRSGKRKMEYFLGTTQLSSTITIHPDEGETFEADSVQYPFTGIEVRKLVQLLIQGED